MTRISCADHVIRTEIISRFLEVCFQFSCDKKLLLYLHTEVLVYNTAFPKMSLYPSLEDMTVGQMAKVS